MAPASSREVEDLPRLKPPFDSSLAQVFGDDPLQKIVGHSRVVEQRTELSNPTSAEFQDRLDSNLGTMATYLDAIALPTL